MDPAIGRRWLTRRQLLDEIYAHTLSVPAAAWREWAGSQEFLNPLKRRLSDLGMASKTRERLLQTSLSDPRPRWQPIAALDAASQRSAMAADCCP
jgi:ATP-binding cassette subfamily B protein